MKSKTRQAKTVKEAMPNLKSKPHPRASVVKVHTSSVERAFRILEELATNGGLKFTDLAAELKRREKVPNGTLSNLLRTLNGLGYLRYSEDDRVHSLGIRLINLGEMAKKRLQESGRERGEKECRELLKGVVEKEKIGAHIAILNSGHAVYLLREDAQGFFGPKIWEGKLQVPHFTAVGKALICCLDEDRIEEIFNMHPIPKDAPKKAITTLSVLIRELAEIRERGWATDDEEHALGVRCVAAPIYSSPSKDKVVASIGVSRRANEFGPDEMKRLGSTILRTAADEATKTPLIRNALIRYYSMSNNLKSGGLR